MHNYGLPSGAKAVTALMADFRIQTQTPDFSRFSLSLSLLSRVCVHETKLRGFTQQWFKSAKTTPGLV